MVSKGQFVGLFSTLSTLKNWLLNRHKCSLGLLLTSSMKLTCQAFSFLNFGAVTALMVLNYKRLYCLGF